MGHQKAKAENPPPTDHTSQSLGQKKVLYYYTGDLLGIWGQWGTFKKGSWKTSNSLRAWRGGRKKRNQSLNEPFV